MGRLELLPWGNAPVVLRRALGVLASAPGTFLGFLGKGRGLCPMRCLHGIVTLYS